MFKGIQQYRINQDKLFYVYNLVIPLLLPATLIILMGPDRNIGLTELGLIIPQIFLYNIILLSANIGTLHLQSSNMEDEFKQYNIGYSICILVLSIGLLVCSFNVFSPVYRSVQAICSGRNVMLLSIAAFIFSYFSLLLLSRNPNISYIQTKPTSQACENREQANTELENKFTSEDASDD